MPMPPDYHMHTPLCHHAQGEPTAYAGHALSVGLSEIGFSEHSPMPRDDFDDWHMGINDLDAYVEKVARARRDHPQLKIKIGLEVDYIPGQEDWIRGLSRRHPWDYLIGSVHYVSDSWDLDNPKKISEWKTRDPFEVWTAYFERLRMAAASDLFDIIGHADLAKKFCFVPKEDCTELFGRFLDAAKETDTAMELNTAGLRKDCREIYPSRRIVEMAFAREVPITFASDAHAPGEVGMNFSDAVALARSVGYKQCRQFSGRQYTSIPF